MFIAWMQTGVFCNLRLKMVLFTAIFGKNIANRVRKICIAVLTGFLVKLLNKLPVKKPTNTKIMSSKVAKANKINKTTKAIMSDLNKLDHM
jgi:hypothetical protein